MQTFGFNKNTIYIRKKKNAHTTSVKDRTCGASNRFAIDERICHLSLKMITILTRQRIARHVVLSLTIQLMLVHVEYCGQPLLHTKLDFYLGGSINKRRHNCIMHLSVPWMAYSDKQTDHWSRHPCAEGPLSLIQALLWTHKWRDGVFKWGMKRSEMFASSLLAGRSNSGCTLALLGGNKTSLSPQ
jgi:hypothetical protein